MPLELLQGLVDLATSDFGGVTKHEESTKFDGEMMDNQSMATVCLTKNCDYHLVRGTKCPKCGKVSAANTGSL